jgi:sporulation protein YlmC with PRC-barrel domain
VKEISVEKLIGRKVVDSEGRQIGRIHEIRAERGEDSCAVEAYYVGGRAMILRIAQWAVPANVGSALESKLLNPFRIGWDQMDLSDPGNPRTTVTREKLRRTRG